MDNAWLIDRLKKLPEEAQLEVWDAYQRPDTEGIALKVLRASDPRTAFVEQAQADILETAHPMGKPIAFRKIAAALGGRLRSAEEAIAHAMPIGVTAEAAQSREILATSGEPERDLQSHFERVGRAAMSGQASAATPRRHVHAFGMAGLFDQVGAGINAAASAGTKAAASFGSILGDILKTIVGVGTQILPVLAPVLIAKLLPKAKEPEAAPAAAAGPAAPAGAVQPQIIMMPTAGATAWYESPVVIIGGLALVGGGVYLATRQQSPAPSYGRRR